MDHLNFWRETGRSVNSGERFSNRVWIRDSGSKIALDLQDAEEPIGLGRFYRAAQTDFKVDLAC